MSKYAYSQNGSTVKKNDTLTTKVFEYPKRIQYKGIWVTMLKDSSVVKINRSRIDFRECLALTDSLQQRLRLADLVIEQGKTELLSLRQENKKFTSLMMTNSEIQSLQQKKIDDLFKDNKKLRKKQGFLVGGITILAVITGVLALK